MTTPGVRHRGSGRHRPLVDVPSVEAELCAANERMAETVGLLETLLSTAPVGFGFVDREFRIMRLNERLAAVNGAPLDAQLGRTVAEVVPQLWSQLEPLYRSVRDTGVAVVNQVVTGETAAEPGRTRHWLVNYYPVQVGGEIIGIGVVVVDVTEQKEAAEARNALMHAAVGAIAGTVEARDPYTAGHQRRVGEISAAVATEIGLTEDDVEGIRLAAQIHDIGKIAVPAEILSRPGRLSPAQFDLVREHAQAGYDIVSGIDFPWPVAEMVLQHHERMDGSGYPRGLVGTDILLGARIIAVADSVEAMASHRPYRVSMGIAAALDHLRSARGTLYDADVVDAFLRAFRDGKSLPSQ